VESPGLYPYLPGLCRALLGEDLLIPSAPTWWCGEPAARQHVLANLGRMVIKPTIPGRRPGPVYGDALGEGELAALAERISASPGDFVGQDPVALTSVPVLDGDRLEPRPAAVRVFLTAKGPGYSAMPGGLTRVAASAGAREVSMQKGGGS